MSLALEDIKNFLLVSETLNVTRASEIAGITQPTMSYSIKRLEQELGGSLLIRLKNGVQLTRLGKEFSQKSHNLLLEWKNLQMLVDRHQHKILGKYSLGIHPSVALYTLENFLPQLQKDHPDLEFQLTHDLSRKITEQVINWKLDFGIVVNPKRHPDLIIKELCKDRVGLFCSKQKRQISETLIYDDHLIQSHSLLKKIKLSKYKFHKHITSESLEVIAKLTSIGYGIGILPERVAQQYKNLKLIDDSILFQDRICLIYRSEKHKDLSGQTIVSYIGQSLL